MGRPTLYDPENTPVVALAKTREGFTLENLAKYFGVNVATIKEWKNKYPAFSAALKEGRDKADSMVEAALFNRAIGYEYEETETIQTGDGTSRKVTIKKTKKRLAPDVTAQIFWLKNRRSAVWRDKHEVLTTGEINIAIDDANRIIEGKLLQEIAIDGETEAPADVDNS